MDNMGRRSLIWAYCGRKKKNYRLKPILRVVTRHYAEVAVASLLGWVEAAGGTRESSAVIWVP
jgi:hypothetical protein